MEPGGIDEEDDAGDHDFAEPVRNQEQRRENDAPETQFGKADRGCEVEHVPSDPEEKGADQDRCDERQERNGDPAGDECAESDHSQHDTEDGTHGPSLCTQPGMKLLWRGERYSGRWQTASMLWPSGSMTKAA